MQWGIRKNYFLVGVSSLAKRFREVIWDELTRFRVKTYNMQSDVNHNINSNNRKSQKSLTLQPLKNKSTSFHKFNQSALV